MSGIISWEEPPGRSAAKDELTAIAEELQKRPGEWALVAEDVTLQAAERFRTGFRREPGFVVKRRQVGDGHNVYIRYNAGPKTLTRHADGSVTS